MFITRHHAKHVLNYEYLTAALILHSGLASPSVFNTYLGTLLMLMNGKSCLIPLLSAFFHYTTRTSIRMLATIYKRLTITTNALPLIRLAFELLPNMLRICVFMSLRNMFLKFAKPREQPRMYTNTNECKAITMRLSRFVTELQRYYVILLIHLSDYLTNGITHAIRHQLALIAA